MAKPPRLRHTWESPPVFAKDIAAVQALFRGEATPHQQGLVIEWLLLNACEVYNMSYRPGNDGRRDTDFSEGKRYVGNLLLWMSKEDPTKHKKDKAPTEQHD